MSQLSLSGSNMSTLRPAGDCHRYSNLRQPCEPVHRVRCGDFELAFRGADARRQLAPLDQRLAGTKISSRLNSGAHAVLARAEASCPRAAQFPSIVSRRPAASDDLTFRSARLYRTDCSMADMAPRTERGKRCHGSANRNQSNHLDAMTTCRSSAATRRSRPASAKPARPVSPASRWAASSHASSAELAPLLAATASLSSPAGMTAGCSEQDDEAEWAAVLPHLTLLREMGCRYVVYADTSHRSSGDLFAPISTPPAPCRRRLAGIWPPPDATR